MLFFFTGAELEEKRARGSGDQYNRIMDGMVDCTGGEQS